MKEKNPNQSQFKWNLLKVKPTLYAKFYTKLIFFNSKKTNTRAILKKIVNDAIFEFHLFETSNIFLCNRK